MNARSLSAAALAIVALTGCTAGEGEPTDDASAVTRTAESLWADRTDFVGDNSKVITLAEETGFGRMGDYTLALETSGRPYAATISFTSLDKPFEATDFTHQATLLLGLVGNLEEVHVTGDGQTFSLTEGEATDALGYDVKNLGQDQARLEEYLEAETLD